MEAFTCFKPLRNRLSQFSSESVISISIRKLHELRSLPIEEMTKYPPWFLLLLIKWAVLYCDPSHPKKRDATFEDFNRLINSIHEIFGCVRVPSDYDNVFLFLKNMAFQQFWLQHPLSSADLGRQILLFDKLATAPRTAEFFKEHIGIEIPTFLELSVMLAAKFLTEKKSYAISASYFATVVDNYEKGTIDKFLDALSLDGDSLKNYLELADKRFKDFEFKLYEQTPLIKKPLLRSRSDFLCYSPNVLLGTLSNVIYDVLKDKEAEAFSPSFGKVFEKYLGVGLDFACCKYFTERDIKAYYPDSLLVDYLLPFADGTVLLESKGIEMSPLARVADDARIVNNNLRDSVIKAIKQGLTLAGRLRENCLLPGVLVKEDVFLLIVTFKDLYLGNGTQFLRTLEAKNDIEAFLAQEHLLVNSIPFDHIYLMSAREFEWLIYVMRRHSKSIPEILRQIIAADAIPSSRKLQLGQHLAHIYDDIKAPDFVTNPAEAMMGRIAMMLHQTKRKA